MKIIAIVLILMFSGLVVVMADPVDVNAIMGWTAKDTAVVVIGASLGFYIFLISLAISFAAAGGTLH